MVGSLQDAGLVVDEKLDLIIEHLRKQDEQAARLELRLAEYSESMAEASERAGCVCARARVCPACVLRVSCVFRRYIFC